MGNDLKRFLTIAGLFYFCLFSIPVIGHKFNAYVGYMIFTVFVVLLPLYVLTSRDALFYLNSNNQASFYTKLIVRIVASLPVIIFGLLSLIFGLAIIVWILYNYLIEMQPQFNSHALFGFGIGPALVYFGASSLKSTWVKYVKQA